MAGLGQHLSQQMGQHQVLMPKMLQAIEVLQLPATELETWLRQASEENEALIVEEPARPEPPSRPRGTREATEAHDEMLRNQPDRESGLAEVLEQQLALLDLPEDQLAWVRFLIGAIDPNGFLSTDDETLLRLAREAGLPGGAPELARALECLRGLEPAGIGARGAVDALLLQLDPDDPDFELLRSLLIDFLEDVAKNKLPSVARALGLQVAELQALIGRLGELNPRPGAELAGRAAPPLRPDVLVERAGDGFEVRVDSASIPAVRIDPEVAELARDRGQRQEVRSYLRGKVDRARWLVDAVHQRADTLARTATRLFEHQHAFLEHGPGHLVPLRMNALADELGIHVSTVSRAVAGKYAQTPWGILPLRSFFQASAGGDADSARDDVREAVREVFAGEDPTRPLSDDDVVKALARRGWKLARRTVTKYRRELGIPSSYRRRRYE